jgi:hypothetical protein
MATTTWNVSKDSRVARRTSDSWEAGSGASDGLPVGLYSGYLYRTLLGFSYSFTGMVSITSAVLWVKTSDQNHVAFGSDPDMYVQRLTESWSEGTSDGLSASNAVHWGNQPAATTTNRATVDVTTSESTWESVTITDLINDAFSAGVFYGLKLAAVDETTADDVTEFFSSEYSTGSDAYIVVTYTTGSPPNAPTGLTPTGDTIIHSLSPTFAGTHSDPDGDAMTSCQVLVYADNGTTLIWDSGTVADTGATFSKVYSGSALTGNTFYKWKGRTKDSSGSWGTYSALQRFKVNSVPTSPTISLSASPTTDIKTLTPSFILTHNDPDASDSQMLAYEITLKLTSDGSTVWSSGEVAVTATVSKTVAYTGAALSWQTSYYWAAKTKDSNGAWSNYSTAATFVTHTTGTPITLDPTGSEVATNTTPSLSGLRATTADSLASAAVEVYASNGTTLVWSSGTFTSGVTSTGFSVTTGTTLTASTTYKWRARVSATIGGTSAWSALQTFITPAATVPVPTTPIGRNGYTDTTPDFTFTRGTNFNMHQLYLYSLADNYVSSIWSSTPVAYAATGSKTVTSGVTLDYGQSYKWKVRVSSDGGGVWSDYCGLTSFSMDSAGIPTLTAPIDSSWETSLTPTFTGTTYNAETIVTFRIYLYASDQTTLVWDSGALAGSGTSFSKVYNGTALTRGSVYYWKASYIKTGGVPGETSGLQDFHINATPTSPTGLVPSTGSAVADTLTPDLKATFADADMVAYGDYPTLFEAEVYRNSDSVLMHSLSDSTGLVAGQNTLTRVAEGSALVYETEYKVRFRYTDSKSLAGSWSSYSVFKPSVSPTVAISAPGAIVNSPTFTISWAITSSGGKAQAAYSIGIVRDSDSASIHSVAKTYSSATSYVVTGVPLDNLTDYTIYVYLWDTDDLITAGDTQAISTSWTAPDSVTEFSAVADIETSSVVLEWTESNLAPADFSHYQLYRREAGDDTWTAYAVETTQTVLTYRDYFAANAVSYDYMMTVFQTVPGDTDLESPDSDISSVILDSDTWHFIGADRSHIFELPVSDESHTEPIQQEVFEPLGSSRKTVVRGRVLGAEGVMEVRWESVERSTARDYINYLKTAGPHILKSPFGDLWEVEFGGPSTKYSGGGHVGVSLTWIEVD